MTIRFDKSMADVAGTKPQRLRLGDWYCEPPTWAKAMEMTAMALLFDVRYRDRLLKSVGEALKRMSLKRRGA